MKVAFISNSKFDGAGIAAHRIFKSVTNNGVEGYFYSNDEIGGIEFKKLRKRKNGIKEYLWEKYYWRKYTRPALRVNNEYDYFTVQKLSHKTTFSDLNFTPDIIHLHWINNILDYESFFSTVPDNIPIIWTMHDMSPFTGGCIYAWECNKFITGCNNCSQLTKQYFFDLPRYTQKLKLNLFRNKNLHFVANSYWLEKQARKSLVFNTQASLRTIHIPIDTCLFKPGKSESNRRDIASNSDFVICFGAIYLNSKRKGLVHLLKALEIAYTKYPNIKCIVYGANFTPPKEFCLPPFYSIGRVQPEDLPKKVFSISDLFIIPSLQEAFGQTCLEAMACGIPVVGFNVGGIPDMIIPGITGLLAEPGNSSDLADKILWMIDHPRDRKNMGENARAAVVKEFSMDVLGLKYIELYNSVLENAIAHPLYNVS